MVDWAINITGNAAAKAASAATAVDTLTAALRAEEKALNSAAVAAQRAAVGSDPKKYTRAADAVKEAAGRVSLLRGESSRLAQEDKIAKFYRGSSGAALVSNSIAKKSSTTWKDLGATIKSGATASISGAGKAAVVAGYGLAVASVAAVGLGASLVYAAKEAATFAFTAADGARSARLLNDAADLAGGGSLQLTAVIDQLARRVPIAKDVLASLGRELRIQRFTGREAQVALTAYATAQSALGSTGGAAVKGIAETSKAMRKFTLGARDAYGEYTALKGTGLTKGDLFAALATTLKTDVASVRERFQQGKITVRQGLEGVDAALQKKFGKTISGQLLSISTQFDKMKEDFLGLFSGSDIEPFLKSLKGITGIFSQDTASGRAFKDVVTRILGDLTKLAESVAPDVRKFILDLGTTAAQPGGFTDAIQGWIQSAKDFAGVLKDIADSIKTIAGAASSVKGFFSKEAKAPELQSANAALDMDRAIRTSNDPKAANAAGVALVLGIKAGIDGAAPQAVNSITSLASRLQAAFKAANEIRSPAGKFKKPAREIPRGAAVGVREATPEAEAAVRDMSSSMQGGFTGAPPTLALPAASGPTTTHTLNIGQLTVVGTDTFAEFVDSRLKLMLRRMAEQGPTIAA